MAGDLNGVAGVQSYSAAHPKKLFISAFSKLRSDPFVSCRIGTCVSEVWWSVGGVAVIVPKDTTFAFVESYLAMREMGDWYRVNKARRTKHEALMEERAGRRLWRREAEGEYGVGLMCTGPLFM
eukprot:CCRYP_017869-RA/>CCRYP_017869-RA protein AED:0.29 eAED:0.29 QI:0/-1/0/1/-1/1/1/0/123